MNPLLSKEEIEALLNTDDFIDDENNIYDFKKISTINKYKLRVLKNIHNKLINVLSKDLSKLLKENIILNISMIDFVSCDEFIDTTLQSTIFSIFNIGNFDEKCILDINHDTALNFINSFANIDNNLIKNEIDIIKIITQNILSNLQNIFISEKIYIDEIFEFKNRNLFINTSQELLIISMQVLFNSNVGSINLCYPLNLINKLLDKYLNYKFLDKYKALNINLNCEAKLSLEEILLKDFLYLECGDIIKTNINFNDNIVFSIENNAMFLGEICKIKNKKAIKIKNNFKNCSSNYSVISLCKNSDLNVVKKGKNAK